MKDVILLLKEMRYELLKMSFLTTFLNTIIFFFIIEIIMGLFDLPLLISVVLSVFFFFINFLTNVRQMELKIFEEKNPEINEMLSTAKDNLEENTVMAMALFEELLEKSKKVSSGTLFDIKKFFFKLTAIFVLSLVLIMSAPISFDLFTNDIPNAVRSLIGRTHTGDLGGEIIVDDLGDDTSIYGDSRIAKLGNEELELTINPELSKIDLSKVKDAQAEELSLNSFPVEVEAVASETSSEQMPKESKLALEYNKKLRDIK